MQTIEDVEQISDLMERVRVASEREQQARLDAEHARGVRNTAAVIAHLDHGVAPITLYRDLLHMSRGMFKRYVDEAPPAAERAHAISDYPSAYGTAEVASKTAQEAADDVRTLEAEQKRLRAVRDKAARLLMDGRTESGERVPPVPNAKIVQVSGLTSARVAQLRRGVR